MLMSKLLLLSLEILLCCSISVGAAVTLHYSTENRFTVCGASLVFLIPYSMSLRNQGVTCKVLCDMACPVHVG